MSSFIRSTWVPALESGKYQQGREYLRRGDNYCCLGLGLQLAGIKPVKDPEEIGDDIYLFDRADAFPTDEQLELLGISEALATALAHANDNGATFAEIGRFLRTGDETELLRYLSPMGTYSAAPVQEYQP